MRIHLNRQGVVRLDLSINYSKEKKMIQKKERIAYVNGEYVPESQAKISVFDHGLLYGDGVYDTLCVWKGYVFKLESHIDRLFRSIHAFKIEMPLDKNALRDVIIRVVKENGETNQYVKCVVTRGLGLRPLLTPIDCKTTVIVFSVPDIWLWGGSGPEKAETAIITNIRRIPSQCLDAKVKNLNYANFVLAKMEAMNAGVDQGIMLDIHGFVNECPGYNLFIVRAGNLYTPPTENILVGVTRETVFEIGQEQERKVVEERMTPSDLYNAGEVFLSSTAGGIIPIVQVDKRSIASGEPGPITLKIHSAYMKMLNEGVHGTKFI